MGQETVFGWRAYIPVSIICRETGRPMLDAFIIEEIKRRERLRQESERSRPVVQIPVPNPDADDDDRPRKSDTEDDEKPQRGVVIIDLAV